ncbi:MAG: hypothetical protein K8I30_18660 [Anaerolineae bacterium]|nr:hypothetical protein [Anaerolineae bacterium]
MTTKTARLHAIQRQIEHLDRRIHRLREESQRFSRIRLGIFAAGLVIAFLAFSQVNEVAGWISALLALAALLGVARFHRRVDDSIRRHAGYRQIKTAHVARIELDWPNIPPETIAAVPPDHPFAVDLDIIGDYSLHRLLDTSVSREGGERLEGWLLNSLPNPEDI